MKTFIFIVLLLVSAQASALESITKGGHTACLKKEWVSDMTSFLAARDKGSFEAYINAKRCIYLKGGLKVTITDFAGLSGNATGFVFNGLKLWTNRHAIDIR